MCVFGTGRNLANLIIVRPALVIVAFGNAFSMLNGRIGAPVLLFSVVSILSRLARRNWAGGEAREAQTFENDVNDT